jgi:hypothetical protein
MSGQMSPLDFVLPSEATLMAADAAGVTADPQLGLTITYRSFTGRTFDPARGTWTPGSTDQVLRAIRNNLSQAEIAASAGVFQSGDVRYLVTRATLLATPGTDDKIVDSSGNVYDMVRWDTDPANLFWRFVMRLVKVG